MPREEAKQEGEGMTVPVAGPSGMAMPAARPPQAPALAPPMGELRASAMSRALTSVDKGLSMGGQWQWHAASMGQGCAGSSTTHQPIMGTPLTTGHHPFFTGLQQAHSET